MRAFRDISYTRPIYRVGLADDRYSLLTKSQLGKCQSVGIPEREDDRVLIQEII